MMWHTMNSFYRINKMLTGRNVSLMEVGKEKNYNSLSMTNI